MNLGELRIRVTVETPPTTKVGGELSGSWTTVCTPFARIDDVSSSQGVNDDSEVTLNQKAFYIRYRNDIDYKHRISYSSQYWQIDGITEIGIKEYLKITATRKTNWP